MKKILVLSCLIFGLGLNAFSVEAKTEKNNYEGRFIIRTEKHGEAWFLNGRDKKLYQLGQPGYALVVLKDSARVVKRPEMLKFKFADPKVYLYDHSDDDLDGLPWEIEKALGTDPKSKDSDKDKYDDWTELKNGMNPLGKGATYDKIFAKAYAGQIVSQDVVGGESWYINPANGVAYFFQGSTDVLRLMQSTGLAVNEKTFSELRKQYPSVNSKVVIRKLSGEYNATDRFVLRGDMIVKYANPKTFKVLNEYYARDEKNLYYYGVKLKSDVDLSSIDFIRSKSRVWGVQGEIIMFIKDKNSVYDLDGRPIVGADPKTFRVSYYGIPYAVDAQSVYYYGEKIDKADPGTLVIFGNDAYTLVAGSYFARDKNFAYFENQIIPGADPSSFAVIGGAYSKDKDHVYNGTKALAGVDPATYRHLADRYAADGSNAYFKDVKIANADVVTFKVLSGGYATDKNAAYFQGRKIEEANPETFEVSKTQSWFARDRLHIYKYGKTVKEYAPGAF